MKAYKMKEETINRKKIGAHWKIEEISELLYEQWKENKNEKNRAFIGIKCDNLFELFHTEGTEQKDVNKSWRKELKDVLITSLIRRGFNPRSSIKGRRKAVKLEYIGKHWVAKIELYPEMRRFC